MEVPLAADVLAEAERAGGGAHQRPQPERAKRDDGEAAIEGCLGNDVERPVPEIGVRVRVEADGEVAVVDDVTVFELQRESRPAAVVVPEPRGEGGIDEQRM